MISYAVIVIIVCISFIQSTEICENLLPGQFRCEFPVIDPITNQPFNCSNNTAPVICNPIPGLNCYFHERLVDSFHKLIPCSSISTENKYLFETSLLLSFFGGILAIDRFYLGYFTLGFLKLITFGGLGIWYLVDVILIAFEVLLPANNTVYARPYFDSYQLVSYEFNF